MKHLHRISLAAAVACTLTYTTFAGEMNCPITDPTPQAATTAEATTPTTDTTSSAASSTDVAPTGILLGVLTAAVQSVGTLL
jgi:hypothetical protein